MKQKVKIVILFLLVGTLTGCDYIRHRHQQGVVAELDGKVLTEDEIQSVTTGLSSEDSVRVAKQYIRQWAINILRYQKAMGSRDEDIETMVDDYRRSLYIHAYEQALIQKRMPKQVEDTVIANFYASHKDQFVLRESILKGILIVVPEDVPKLDKLRKLISQPNEKNLEKIEKYAYQYSMGYELFTDKWRTTSDILLRLPVEQDILQQELRQHSLIEVSDSTTLYLLRVTDKCMSGEYMPLEFAKDEIRQIVLTDRQVVFLQESRDELYENALKYKKLKIYENTNE